MTAYIYPVDPATLGQDFGTNPGGYNPVGGHTGKDFKVWTGTPVHAAGDGVVVQAQDSSLLPADYRADGSGPNPYWINPDFAGQYVAIDHGATEPASIYAHLSEIRVRPGQRVTKGQVIGLSGASGGASSGPHLHFEMMPPAWDFNNGTYGRVNPAIYCAGHAGTITAQSTKPKESTLSAAEVKQITDVIKAEGRATRDYLKALAYTGWQDEQGRKHPGFMWVIEENQKRIDKDLAQEAGK